MFLPVGYRDMEKSFRSITVGLLVPDPEEALHWYQQFLGDHQELRPSAGVVEMEMLPYVWIQFIRGNAKPGTSVFRLGVEDIYEMKYDLDSLDILTGEIHEVPGKVRYFQLMDPYGYSLSFYQEL